MGAPELRLACRFPVPTKHSHSTVTQTHKRQQALWREWGSSMTATNAVQSTKQVRPGLKNASVSLTLLVCACRYGRPSGMTGRGSVGRLVEWLMPISSWRVSSSRYIRTSCSALLLLLLLLLLVPASVAAAVATAAVAGMPKPWAGWIFSNAEFSRGLGFGCGFRKYLFLKWSITLGPEFRI